MDQLLSISVAQIPGRLNWGIKWVLGDLSEVNLESVQGMQTIGISSARLYSAPVERIFNFVRLLLTLGCVFSVSLVCVSHSFEDTIERTEQ